MDYIIKVGINGGRSIVSIPESKYQGMDLGVDGNIRVVYVNGDKSYPIQEIIEAPQEFRNTYIKLQGLSID